MLLIALYYIYAMWEELAG